MKSLKISPELKEYVRKHGNVLSIGYFYQMQG